jgi:hypothetical protein
MVIGIAHGALTAQDLDDFVGELAAASAFRYRKIIDVMTASLRATSEELTAFSKRIQTVLPDGQTGPIAIVTNEANGPAARLFAQLTEGKRPAGVFRSIREAREWLYANSRVR